MFLVHISIILAREIRIECFLEKVTLQILCTCISGNG